MKAFSNFAVTDPKSSTNVNSALTESNQSKLAQQRKSIGKMKHKNLDVIHERLSTEKVDPFGKQEIPVNLSRNNSKPRKNHSKANSGHYNTQDAPGLKEMLMKREGKNSQTPVVAHKIRPEFSNSGQNNKAVPFDGGYSIVSQSRMMSGNQVTKEQAA